MENCIIPLRGRGSGFALAAGAFLLAAMVLVLAGGVALAEDAADEEESSDKTVKLEAVKVTANKMEESLKDVPQSITVIDEVEIEEKGIESMTDVIDNIPGMAYSDDHGVGINFRGLNSSMFTMNNPVTMYVDGIAHSGKTGFDTSLVNVERIEVLRGAQSTLYGKNAMGAVINVVTKDPTNEWHGKVGAEYGSWDYVKGLAAMNGPLIKDKLFLGLSAQYDQDNGWIKNDYEGMEEDANRERDRKVNGYLLMTPNDDLRVRLAAHHSHKKTYWGNEYVLAHGTNLDDFNADDAKHVSYDVANDSTTDDNSQSLTVEYNFDGFKLNSITTHKQLEVDALYDSDHSDAAAYKGLEMFDENEEETWSQELRLSGGAPKEFRWTCGVYGDIGNRKQGPYGQQFVQGGTAYEQDAHSDQDTTTMAAFGQVMAPLGSGFELTLGARLQRIRKEMDLDMYYQAVGAAKNLYYSMHGTKTWNAFLPKAALSYAINDNWNTYISYSHGYMPGGYNFFAMSGSADSNAFKPQRSKNYEWGLKADYGDLRLGTALFYMDIKDIHVYKTAGGTGMYYTSNAKKAHSYGAEFEATYLPVKSLELSGSVSLIKAKYDDYDADVKQYDGEDIDQTPSHIIRLSAAYHAPCGFYARVDARHFGSRSYYDDYNKGFTKADAYTVVDTKVGYRFDDFDVYAYVNNITDEEYVTAFRSNTLVTIAGVGDPRTIGAGVMYYF